MKNSELHIQKDLYVYDCISILEAAKPGEVQKDRTRVRSGGHVCSF
jgi:hypothetical protein